MISALTAAVNLNFDFLGEQQPCVMLGMIANRDLESYEDLLDPNMAKKMNEAIIENRKRLGIKNVRFNPNEEIIPSQVDSNENVWMDDLVPSPRAGIFSKNKNKNSTETKPKPQRIPVESDSPTYDDLSNSDTTSNTDNCRSADSGVQNAQKLDRQKPDSQSRQPERTKMKQTRDPLKNPEIKMFEDSSIEQFIPDKNKFGDVKRYYQGTQDRFRNRLDHQPERPMEFKNPKSDYYYDEAGEFSHYYYF
jgi:hypothetical protein